jgi:hypothetical protein
MNVGFERTVNTTDEWYTPQYIIDSLGKFDLDPCAPIVPLYQTAGTMYNELEDGLAQNWEGRVWLNPPYSRPLINKFMRRMAEHNHGTALIFSRTDTELFHTEVFGKATAVKFLKGRIRFLKPDGTEAGAPGCGSVLIAYGDEDANILEVNKLDGKFIRL